MHNPIDDDMKKKYKKATWLESPLFLLSENDIKDMKEKKYLTQINFYKEMRRKLNVLMDKNGKPTGGKWSYDEENRNKFPTNYEEPTMKSYSSKIITHAREITSLSIHNFDITEMIYPTTRSSALAHMRLFLKTKLGKFGPFQDAIRENVVFGYHSNLSAVLNVGLITPRDILDELSKYKASRYPIQSIEGFVRQLIGWREYIRFVYCLYGKKVNHWNYLKLSRPLPRSWYSGTTGMETLDKCISKAQKYAYVHHIERLMLLNNYGILLGIKYNDMKNWFTRMFIDGYSWAMTNVAMNVNSINPEIKFMKRVYLTNGNYLKKMGLKISKADAEELDALYKQFLLKHKTLLSRDYVISGQITRLIKNT